MKNLFDFATKELSQDAFICWLVSNYDNKENEELKKIAYAYINYLADSNYNYENNDIKHLMVQQQALNMDIIIDIWENELTEEKYKNTTTSDFVIIIEDKADSSAHNKQLLTYGEKIDSWDKNHKKVFYKSNYLSLQDVKEINRYIFKENKDFDEMDHKDWVIKYSNVWNHEDIKIYNNNNDESAWKIFDIDFIYEFFSKFECKDSKSEIFDSYVEYICKKYRDLNEISNDLIEDWNLYNFSTFLEKKVKEKYKNYAMSIWLGEYMGMYVSYLFEIDDISSSNKIVLEFFFRKYSDKVNSTIHPHIYHGKDESWHIFDDYKEEDEKYLSDLRDRIKKSGSIYFKPYKSKNCIGTSISNNDIPKNINKEEFLEELDKRIQDFKNIFK